MKIVVIGGSGLIGSKLVAILKEQGHEAVAAAPRTGVNTLTGVGHHVVLSSVGGDRSPDSGYLRAKVTQEKLTTDSEIPYTIVRATQFFEFTTAIAEGATVDGQVHLPPVQYQPMAAQDVSSAVARAAIGTPVDGVQEIGGPERRRMDEFVGAALALDGDPREVVVDEHATYFGTELGEDSLVPGPDALLGTTTYAAWRAAR